MAQKSSKKKHKPAPKNNGASAGMAIAENLKEHDLGAAFVGVAFEHEVLASSVRSDFLIRLLTANNEAVSDCELLELILSSANPAIDASSLAIELLERFGSINRVISAEHDLLAGIDGICESILKSFAMMHLTSQRMLKADAIEHTVLDSWKKLEQYFQLKLGYRSAEELHILFLDRSHRLIADEIMHRGTYNDVPVYPREIVKRSLELSAAAIILVKSVTQGDLAPSKRVIENVTKIVEATATVNVTVHDYVIVSAQDSYSFKAFELL